MRPANSIVIKKETNGNVTVLIESIPYTLLAESYLTKQINSVIVRGKGFSGRNEYFFEEVEKVVRDDGTEVVISDNDVLFDELNNFFFFKLSGSGGGGGTIPGLAMIVKSKKITQNLSVGDNTVVHLLGSEIISFSVKDGDKIVATSGNDIDSNNFNINLSGGETITSAEIYLNYQ